MDSYLELEQIFSDINNIGGAIAILSWDNATMLPKKSGITRMNQLATLKKLSHNLLTDPKILSLLNEAEYNQDKLNDWQKANLRQIKHIYKHETAIDTKLLEQFSLAGSECEHIWREARAENNFVKFAPYLKKVLKLSREIALKKSDIFGTSRYEALLDYYDQGRTTKEIDIIFARLKSELPNLLKQIIVKQSKENKPINIPNISIEKQKELGLFFMNQLGFDFDYGRLDVSHHPFCGGIPGDVRITTRYNENDFTSSLMGILHETGHALYEANLPDKWRMQPVGNALGMAIHESQSLIIEMQLSRSLEFLSFAQEKIKEIFGVRGMTWEMDNLRKIYHRVHPSLIRVDADEVTYPFHVIMRYEIEKLMINGDLEVDDLPEIWNKKMEEYLGITPDSDKNGCMQDIHWTDGSFGYFPTYSLGAIIASQLFNKIKIENPDLPSMIMKGDFRTITHWLHNNIHSYGSLLLPNDLLKKATGEEINVDIYLNHLRNRYL